MRREINSNGVFLSISPYEQKAIPMVYTYIGRGMKLFHEIEPETQHSMGSTYTASFSLIVENKRLHQSMSCRCQHKTNIKMSWCYLSSIVEISKISDFRSVFRLYVLSSCPPGGMHAAGSTALVSEKFTSFSKAMGRKYTRVACRTLVEIRVWVVVLFPCWLLTFTRTDHMVTWRVL